MKYRFIQAHSADYKTTRLCEVLGVSSSGYYDWRNRAESHRARTNRRLVAKLQAFHRASRDTYGSPRLHRDLVAAGESVSENRVARLMRRAGITSKMARKFVITTQSKNTLAPAPDRLQRHFTTAKQDQAWVCDTTFVATRQGWLFLAVILDLYSRQIIGWSMGDRNNSELVGDALRMAIQRRGKTTGTIIHSDQGSPYASSAYQALLKEHGLVCSMSRKGECLDNAVAESFFGTLKTELTDHEDYRSKAEARQSIFEYMEIFYNRKRRHSTLNYMTPLEYEQQSVSNF